MHRPGFCFGGSFCVDAGKHASAAGHPRCAEIPAVGAHLQLLVFHEDEVTVAHFQLIGSARNVSIQHSPYLHRTPQNSTLMPICEGEYVICKAYALCTPCRVEDNFTG